MLNLEQCWPLEKSSLNHRSFLYITKEVSNKVFNSSQYIPLFQGYLLKVNVDIYMLTASRKKIPTMGSFSFIRKEFHMFSDTNEKLNDLSRYLNKNLQYGSKKFREISTGL
ncbi:hypothetical protein V1477_000244 [Vespula maculifrons]|uniref:Uncharacterized protein n=1 Tax=Vespula maculifrons TaxID=7453 RepID=A0ABD2D138_VESMC